MKIFFFWFNKPNLSFLCVCVCVCVCVDYFHFNALKLTCFLLLNVSSSQRCLTPVNFA